MYARGAGHLERVVQHYLLAGRTHDAASLAERAAQQAAYQLAFHSAASLLELALQHAQDSAARQRLRLAAAEACAHAGRSLAAAQHYEQAAGASDDPELRLRALVCYCISGHAREGLALLSRLAAELQVPITFKPMSHRRGLLLFLILLLTGAPLLRKRARGAAPAQSLPLLWRAAPALLVPEPERACYFVARARQGQASVYGQALSFHLALLGSRCIPMVRPR